jgi:hypothetical protein
VASSIRGRLLLAAVRDPAGERSLYVMCPRRALSDVLRVCGVNHRRRDGTQRSLEQGRVCAPQTQNTSGERQAVALEKSSLELYRAVRDPTSTIRMRANLRVSTFHRRRRKSSLLPVFRLDKKYRDRKIQETRSESVTGSARRKKPLVWALGIFSLGRRYRTCESFVLRLLLWPLF